MSMTLLVVAMCILFVSGLASLLLGRYFRAANLVGPVGAVLACVVGMPATLNILLGGPALSLDLPWQVPLGSFHIAMDGLSAIFLLAILVLTAVAAIYGNGYLRAYRGIKSVGSCWFFYNVLAASMAMVVLARNGVLFLMAWEVMSLASFFLVMFEDDKPAVRQAGWTYLVATHLGTAFLLVLFFLLGRQSGSLDFDGFRGQTGVGAMPSVVFLLAVVGFGTKAGFMPFHVWLPEAHPAAPSHVSAVMSGVMIKTGIYGLARTLTFLDAWPAWWGWTLLGIGVFSGVMGVLQAIAQHDLKRLLAYHSVENIGIIAIGLGVGMLGRSYGMAAICVLGFAGALLHVLNHAAFKGLLFLCAGSVLHATSTGEIDRLGGLIKRMPTVAITFLIAAVAISGLPPLNGFVSEFLVYLGALNGCLATGPSSEAMVIVGLLVVGALALIGGLAAACFAKAFGIVFLGAPRSQYPATPHEPAASMRLAMVLLSGVCISIGLGGPWIVSSPGAPGSLNLLAGMDDVNLSANLSQAAVPLRYIVAVTGILAAVLLVLIGLRRWLLSGRSVTQGCTWDCGYVVPSARMQYTASSFAQPITNIFHRFLGFRQDYRIDGGLFPSQAQMSSHARDTFLQDVYKPAFGGIEWISFKLRWLQHGRIQLYVLYIVVTLLIVMVWGLGQ